MENKTQKEILINADLLDKRVAVVNNGHLEEFYIEQPQDKTIVGNIYKGRIESVVPSLNAAFVDIGLNKKGFLYLSEIDPGVYEPAEEIKPVEPLKLKKGDEVLVQVVKEAFGTKGPRVSGHIGLAGRYLVLTPQHTHWGVSRRIDNETERKRLRTILSKLRLSKNAGFIVRTAAAGKSAKELIRDARFLLKLWSRIKKEASHRTSPSFVYEEYDLVLRILRDSFTEDVARVIVDSKSEYRRIKGFVGNFQRDLARRIQLYQGPDLFHERNMEKQINKIFERCVYLKSKCYIIIEPTEGLVVIDVNSGGFKKNSTPEEAAFRINSEAAVEIARQLRLRDLGGIIVIDFIDMEKEKHRRGVLNILNHHLSKDKAKYDCLGISKFGLVQLTRERIHNTIQAQTYQPCPYCQGKGRTKSAMTLCIAVFRQLKRHLQLKRPAPSEVNLSINPAVASLIEKNRDSLRILEREFRTKINFISNPAQHLEDIKIQ
ncbi:MAG: Rne/Rng family ribonuclease [Candidatus Omnitrophica bacterium]|nr:Rne/Rng family ribonuclease [Candidatus Omnitrophota bacterium]MBU1871251.1 Rne/Rng family ribonuclease [Candidatus Omnitrophota bacterium]